MCNRVGAGASGVGNQFQSQQSSVFRNWSGDEGAASPQIATAPGTAPSLSGPAAGAAELSVRPPAKPDKSSTHAHAEHEAEPMPRGSGRVLGDNGDITVIETSKPNPQRAKRIVDALTEFFGNRVLKKGRDKYHRTIPKAMREEFRQRYPGLPVPTSLVFKEGGNNALGAVFSSREKPFDLGAGTGHRHTHKGASEKLQTLSMQHVWFTRGNMEAVFDDKTLGPGMMVAEAYLAPRRK